MFQSKTDVSHQHSSFPRLLGDVGGTNARFGWQTSEDAEMTHVQVLPCSEYPTLYAAITAYLAAQQLATPTHAAIGIANPVTDDLVVMTNHHWQFSIGKLRADLGLKHLLILNDFMALALSIPHIPNAHKRQIGGTAGKQDAAIGLIGPGTGLGVSGLLPIGHQDQWTPISGEGGHVSLGASNALELAVIERLQKRYGHVSAERVLSGMGLVDLYHALGDIHGDQPKEITTPSEVLERAKQQTQADTTANLTIDMFCSFLGTVAGDLALTIGARGGMYIGGGIVPRLGKRFDASAFRTRFEAKGRFKTYLSQIPVWVIDSPVSPALSGASRALSMQKWWDVRGSNR
ncbi:MAG: glucokinase [Cytophagales bacterium]|nr:glucokinase [Cytophagales bacterium]